MYKIFAPTEEVLSLLIDIYPKANEKDTLSQKRYWKSTRDLKAPFWFYVDETKTKMAGWDGIDGHQATDSEFLPVPASIVDKYPEYFV